MYHTPQKRRTARNARYNSYLRQKVQKEPDEMRKCEHYAGRLYENIKKFKIRMENGCFLNIKSNIK